MDRNMQQFLAACEGVTGVSVPADESEYTRDMSGSRRAISGVLIPENQEAVAKIVEFANRYEVKLYPISRGYNWGLGTRLPVTNDCVIVDLRRLDRIVGSCLEFGTITVEAGVSQIQVQKFLNQITDIWYLPTTGAPPESSIVGNALDRGDALGPGGERAESCCALKVLLGTGEVITTGYGSFGDSELQALAKHGLGPALQGLFCQSNFGIVLEATFYLQRFPAYFQPFIGFIQNEEQLEQLTPELRNLHQTGVLKTNGWAIWNRYKMIASETQFPWSKTRKTPLPPNSLPGLSRSWGKFPWVLVGALYSPSWHHARGDRRMLKRQVGPAVAKLLVLTPVTVAVLRFISKYFGKFLRMDLASILKALVDESVFCGHTTRKSSRTLYWRKRDPAPTKIAPDRDQCGLVWLCLAAPFRSANILPAVAVMEKIILEHGFEPQIAFTAPTERLVYFFPTIIFDRAVGGEAQRAHACRLKLSRSLAKLGVQPYRLSIEEMNLTAQMQPEYREVLAELKRLFDPKGIIAPGRYIPNQEESNGNP